MTRTEAVDLHRRLVGGVRLSRPGSLVRSASLLSPVALAIVFWYSLAKRFTSYTQLFLGLAMAVAPVGGWLAAGGRGGIEPWLLGLAIGTWVGGFDVLYACQDLDFDRAHGLRSIPVRFGVGARWHLQGHARRHRRLPCAARRRCAPRAGSISRAWPASRAARVRAVARLASTISRRSSARST